MRYELFKSIHDQQPLIAINNSETVMRDEEAYELMFKIKQVLEEQYKIKTCIFEIKEEYKMLQTSITL